MSGFIVTGTDTDVGKTIVAAALVAATGGRYWKPIQAGLAGETDAQIVQRLSGAPDARILPEVYRLATPASPHVAAEIDGLEIELDRLQLPETAEWVAPLIVEGAGGVLVPLTRRVLQADLFARWDLPVILVASTRLGTINHSLLSIEALKRRAIEICGVAFVGEGNADSERTICEFGKVRRLGCLPMLAKLTPEALAAAFAQNFNREDFL
jgi:dethiobiotin synthetase